jgi:hypothetical protein
MEQAMLAVLDLPINLSSASRNLLSNDALWATRGWAPIKAANCSITSPQGGAAATMEFVIPVYDSIKELILNPGFIRL